MSAVVESLRQKLDQLEREADDENIRKEIARWRIRLQRGSLKHKIVGGSLTTEQKERALRRLIRKKGWKRLQ